MPEESIDQLLKNEHSSTPNAITSSMDLVGNESVLSSNEVNGLLITNLRVRYHFKSFDNDGLISFLLSELDSCSMVTKSHPIFIILFILCLIAAIFVSSDAQTAAIICGLLFIFLYFFTRKVILKIASKSAAIEVSLSGLNRAMVVKIIGVIEQAKLALLPKIP